MQEPSAKPSPANYIGFVIVIVLAFALPMVWNKFNPPPPKPANAPVAEEKQKKDDKAAEQTKAAAEKPGQKQLARNVEPKPRDEPVDQTTLPKPAKPEATAKAAPAAADNDDRRWLTIGSVDEDLTKNPYRMLVTLDREGGAVARLELSSRRYRDLDDRSGYLGHLVMDDSDQGPGCLVQVVGAGTPAANADIRAGDRVMEGVYRGRTTAIDGVSILEAVLRSTEPGEPIDLMVRRGGETLKKTVELIRRPLEVIRPERRMPSIIYMRNGPLDATHLFDAKGSSLNCPTSFLTTLQQIDDDKLRADEDPDAKFEEELARELPGVALRNRMWTIESPKKGDATPSTSKVVFSCEVPDRHLKITKTYELAKVEGQDSDAPAYHLVLSLAITNNDTKKHEVAYRQDGPNGLPVEGAWYVSTKVGRTWSAEGLRDVDYQLADTEVGVKTCAQLSEKVDKTDKFRLDIGESSLFAEHPPRFFAVDAQYFSVAMIPDAASTAKNIERAIALRVGDIEELRRTLTNTSFRLIGKTVTIEPGATCEPQRFEIFAGPKRTELLASYQLSGLICYGWPIFEFVAVKMTWVLDHFYLLVHNYGLAIIMLTILVRLALFPVSRRQAQNTQRMQKLQQKMQPEMKEIQKKYKSDPEALQKAQRALWQKYDFNPLSTMGGCLLMLIQMPIFLGLYRALQVNVELRDAPLISSAVRWCSNLAGPDMLFNWSSFMPNAVNSGIGFQGIPLIGAMFGLGPYLNLFPIITLCLFVLQQKVMMPPPADEQAAAQQKMMKYMMVFMGLMFFKIAAGLCIYFIASTFWGLAEKQMISKTVVVDGDPGQVDVEKPRPNKSAKPRLTESERELIRRQKRRK